MKLAKLFPWLAAALALATVAAAMLPSGKVRGFAIGRFASLPVLEGGRVKPLDSVARNSLLVIRSQQEFRYQGHTVSADEWLLDLMFRPTVADQQPVFVINDPDVLGLIGLKQTSNRYFTFNDLGPHLQEIQDQAQTASAIDPKQRTRFQSAVVNLFDRIYLYYKLRNTLQLAGTPGLAFEIQTLGTPDAAQRQADLVRFAQFRPLPPLPGQSKDAWQSVGEALQSAATGRVHPDLALLAQASTAYATGDAQGFNAATRQLEAHVLAQHPSFVREADHEALFNRTQPFYLGMVIYVAALLALFISWMWKSEVLQPTAFALLVVGALVHTFGLAFRIILQGRPPVTNLYSSAVFVGWGAVILGIVLERLYKKGFGTAVAAAAGFASLIVAQHLATDGDTMEMMRAVLDSNFWLATHVVTITIGYSGTFLAGALAIGYTFWRWIRGLSGAGEDRETAKALVDMTYGVICFALFFSFVGTVLGGIWADQSWGRFWGWDPKENGALLIVLWNAIILHARWAGYIRERGIMAMAIFGNIITSLSWFGVNMLGVGLHSYGFTDSGFTALAVFIATQVVMMGLCLMPVPNLTAKPRSGA
ncbi:MAG: cytochrome c biogenesis protein CcsA [Acidobacteriota bacterium]|nr:cytochrome c biogenesis protein CcsA [Acidobacteriota bacterium]